MAQAGTFVGRRPETGELASMLDETLAGRGAVAFISGPPGIGKTRFVAEFERAARSHPIQVIWVRGSEHGPRASLRPVRDLLRSLLQRPEVADAPFRATTRDLIRDMVHDAADSGLQDRLSDPQEALAQASESVIEVVRTAASLRPLMLVFDDVHAFDVSSLRLLWSLARETRGMPVLVVVTARDQEKGTSEDGERWLSRIARESVFLPLLRFSRDEVRALLAESGVPVSDEDTLNAVFHATEGNPFFVSEMARQAHVGGWGAVLPKVPTSAFALLQRRMESLGEPLSELLRVASVAGRDFTAPAVAALTGETPAAVEDALAEAERADVVSRADGARTYRFAHGLYREVLYRHLERARRAELHLRVAAWLEQTTPGRATDLEERLHHRLGAADVAGFDAVVSLARDAASAAMGRLAFDSAAELLGTVLHRLPKEARFARDRALLLVELGQAALAAGDTHRGKTACVDAAALARTIGDAEILAQAALAYGSDFAAAPVDSTLVALLTEARGILPPHSALAARVSARLAGAIQPAEHPADAVAMAHEAIAAARALGDEATLLAVLHSAGSALADFDEPARRADLNREAVKLARTRGARTHELRAHLRLVFDCFEDNDMGGAVASLEAYASVASEFRQPRHQWQAPLLRAMFASLTGRFAEAEAHRTESERIALLAGEGAVTHALHRLTSARECWDLQALRALEPEVAELASGANLVYATVVQAAVAGRIGEIPRARAATPDHVLDLEAVLFEGTWLAEAVARTDQRDAARRLLKRLSPYGARWATNGVTGMGSEGPYATSLGLLAATIDDFQRAFSEFERALIACDRMGARPAKARALYEYAIAKRKVGDHAAAEELEREAASIAQELGIGGLAERLAVTTRTDEGSSPFVFRASTIPPPAFSAVSLLREGDLWVVRSDRAELRLRASRGLHMLAELVGRPHEPIHVLDLTSAGGGADAGDAGPMIDEQAMAAYRKRLAELRGKCEDAEELGNLELAASIREEMETLARELVRGVGLGGRGRRVHASVERARVNVQRRLRDAIGRIAELDVHLGQHFDAAVRTGYLCEYSPHAKTPARPKRSRAGKTKP